MKFAEFKLYENIRNYNLGNLSLDKLTNELPSEFRELLKLMENNPDKSIDSEEVSKIRRVLWNELELDSLSNPEILFPISIILHHDLILSDTDFKVLMNMLIREEIIDSTDICKFIYTQIDKIDNIDDWASFVKTQFSDYSSETPDLLKTVEFYFLHTVRKTYNDDEDIGIQAFDGFIDDSWLEMINKIDVLISKPEYIDYTIEATDNQILWELLDWLPWSIRTTVLTYLLERVVNKLPSISDYDALDSKMEADPILSEFPRSLEVLGNKIGELPPQTIGAGIMEKIPSNFIQTWLPKYVYSKPEINQKIRIYFPGGDGIGHSAIIIKTNEGMMLFDFGLSVVNSTSPRWLPLLEKVDAVFLSHAHLDHSGSFPILYQNNRKLPWFATKPTRILSEMLWHDTSNIIKRNYPESYFNKDTNLKNLGTQSNILNVMNNYNEIKLNSPISVLPQVEVTAHSAGHLFGSTGFEINIAGKRLLYTGDFNTRGTQMLKGATFDTEVDLAIFDGTYYGKQETRPDPIAELKKVFEGSDRVLIPAFSVGRSQEILYALKKLGVDKTWNIYLTGMAGRVAKNLNLVFSDPKKDVGVIPFSSVRFMDGDQFKEKSVVIGGQGMLQAGTSRRLLEYTAEDPKTSVVLCGYQAPNTLGYWLGNKHPDLISKFSQKLYNISLSGHTPGNNLSEFIDDVKGKKIMVHAPKGAYQSNARKDVMLPSEIEPFPFI